ncbi:MAG: tetratricopeptide repeat protein, partial [Chloroflexota bacterium]
MEINLIPQADGQVAVTCNGQSSHTFDLLALTPEQSTQPTHARTVPHPLDDPVSYGQALYAALFAPDSLARQTLESYPEQILLVIEEPGLQSIPFEYAYGPDGFLVLDHHFVRGLPPAQRITPAMDDSAGDSPGGLHIVAVPSNPLHRDVPPLDIEGEWQRLAEIVDTVDHAVTLVRTRPPTLEQLRTLLANQRNRIVHFMGHGVPPDGHVGAWIDQNNPTESALLFEDATGAPKPEIARNIVRRLRGTAFLVVLSACQSATPGETSFSNIAAALVANKIPYSLGMRFNIFDDDARRFARVFYSELARGSTVEEATLQARLALSDGPNDWAVGVPVLYTCLAQPNSLSVGAGKPRVLENQPPLEVSALPRAEGAFQGRIAELIKIGDLMTGDSRPQLLTIHGGGGQGKTALAREAVERFAFAWPGGVWAISLEMLPTRHDLVTRLATFLGIETQQMADDHEIEQQVLTRLGRQRTLIVLDNAETLVDAVMDSQMEGQVEGHVEALDLVDFVLNQLMGTRAYLLVTSRTHLGWSGEVALDLGGLSPQEGAALFRQSAPQRRSDMDAPLARALSEKVDGHPLALRLLGRTFNELATPLTDFVAEYESQLIQARDRYRHEDHRHRTLYASIETSVRHLDDELRTLLAGLWVFHAPFLAESATEIFAEIFEDERVPDGLHKLWQRGLLARQSRPLRDGTVLLYQLLSVTRPYVEKVLAVDVMPDPAARATLLHRFGLAYADLARTIYINLNSSAVLIHVAQQTRDDLARGHQQIDGEDQARYWLHWGWILRRLGDPTRGLQLTQQALTFAQDHHQRLALEALNNMALVYDATGKPKEALALYEQALPIMREVGDRAGEATTLNNMAGVYRSTGKPKEALALYEQALPIRREVGDRAGEATTLNNMAGVYRSTGKPKEALALYEQ